MKQINVDNIVDYLYNLCNDAISSVEEMQKRPKFYIAGNTGIKIPDIIFNPIIFYGINSRGWYLPKPDGTDFVICSKMNEDTLKLNAKFMKNNREQVTKIVRDWIWLYHS